MFRIFITLVLVFSAVKTYGQESQDYYKKIDLKQYSWSEVWQKVKSPLKYKESKYTLFAGGSLVAALLLTRNDTVDPFQESVSERKPLGSTSKFGDLMGKMVPNGAYALGMYLHYLSSKSSRSSYRTLYMLEVSAYSGLTATVLKVLANERRPNGSDRKSFPSGHTTTAFAFAAAVAEEHPWYYAVPAYALATFVGFSRINDNKHYLHDVVGGAAIGIAYAKSLSRENSLAKKSANFHILPTFDGQKFMLSFISTNCP